MQGPATSVSLLCRVTRLTGLTALLLLTDYLLEGAHGHCPTYPTNPFMAKRLFIPTDHDIVLREIQSDPLCTRLQIRGRLSVPYIRSLPYCLVSNWCINHNITRSPGMSCHCKPSEMSALRFCRIQYCWRRIMGQKFHELFRIFPRISLYQKTRATQLHPPRPQVPAYLGYSAFNSPQNDDRLVHCSQLYRTYDSSCSSRFRVSFPPFPCSSCL